TLPPASLKLELLTEAQFHQRVKPEHMVNPTA
ncbi:hypothetical protein MOC54_00610, partial [Bacillus spizizenii]|nr:hypothetical protein [Bacillus spizizenii]